VRWDRELEQDTADAVHNFYSTNETDNLLNVIEAPQLVDSISDLNQTLGNQSVLDAIKNNLKLKFELSAAHRRRLRKANFVRAGKLSSLYLFYSFGIAPLISDMRKVQNALASMRSKMRAARTSAGRIVSIHASSRGSLYYVDGSGNELGSSMAGDNGIWSLKADTVKRTVTVRGYRAVKYSNKVFSDLDYLLSRFGVTGPTALAWELVPFSFVVDWFVDLRNITDRLDNLLTGSNKSILDICVSDKTEYTNTLVLKLSTHGAPVDLVVPQDGQLMCKDIVSLYHRSPSNQPPLVRLAGRFGKKQASLLAALVHQKVANLVRR
jgi:hypothetical protein